MPSPAGGPNFPGGAFPGARGSRDGRRGRGRGRGGGGGRQVRPEDLGDVLRVQSYIVERRLAALTSLGQPGRQAPVPGTRPGLGLFGSLPQVQLSFFERAARDASGLAHEILGGHFGPVIVGGVARGAEEVKEEETKKEEEEETKKEEEEEEVKKEEEEEAPAVVLALRPAKRGADSEDEEDRPAKMVKKENEE